MSTNFPTSLDTLTNPTSTDSVATVDHAAQHANANDAIEALQAKVGVNSSAVTTSHDYKLSEVTTTDKAVGKTATQTLTNKTLTAPAIAGSTGTGVHDFGGADSFEIPNSATPTVNADGEIAVDTSVTDFSHGIIKYYGGEELAVIAVPVSELGSMQSGDIPTYNATSDEFELVQPTSVTIPGPAQIDVNPLSPSTNPAATVTMDDYCLIASADSGSGFTIARSGTKVQTRNTTTDWADADSISSHVVLGNYLYVLIKDTTATPDANRVYRYLLSDITSSPAQMTFSGSNQMTTSDAAIRMGSDGTNIYLTFLAGNSANAYEIGKYTISGTDLAYSSTITLAGTPSFTKIGVDTNGNFFIIETSNSYIYKYNSSGTNTYTSTKGLNTTYDDGILMYNDDFYAFNSTGKIFYKIPV